MDDIAPDLVKRIPFSRNLKNNFRDSARPIIPYEDRKINLEKKWR